MDSSLVTDEETQDGETEMVGNLENNQEHQEPTVSQRNDDSTSLSPDQYTNDDDSIIYGPNPPRIDNPIQTIPQTKADASKHLIKEILTANEISVDEDTIDPPEGQGENALKRKILELKEDNARKRRRLAMYEQYFFNVMKMGPSDGNI